MNPFWKISLAVTVGAFVLQLLWIVYFFGFFRGSFEEFKQSTKEKLQRLESVFFNDVQVIAKNTKPAAAEFIQEKKGIS